MKNGPSMNNGLYETDKSIPKAKPFCVVCGQTISDNIFAECERCHREYHVTCLKKRATMNTCSSHFLTIKRQFEE
jgi:NMD protein affecting ribosome stability and mRNA decay